MEKQLIKNNILAFDDLLSDANVGNMQISIAERVRQNRLDLNLTQKALASRAGISFATYRRFEITGEISLKSLLKIAIVLDSADAFSNLFTHKQYQSIDELVAKTEKIKQRGRKNE